jgi:hypothetical protein
MEILKFENSPRPARKKSSSSKIVLGFASIAAVAMLGSTLAASITLNTGSAVEFGQGVAQTTACDSSIVVTPTSTFNNTDNRFELTSFQLSDVDATACLDKLFTVNAYEDGTSSSLGTYTFRYNSGTPAETGGTVVIVSDVATFTLTTALNLTDDDVAKMTLETSN